MRIFVFLFSFCLSEYINTIDLRKEAEIYAHERVDPNCPDLDKAEKCELSCIDELGKCIEACDGHATCQTECARAEVACVDACPCHADCIDGCDGCDNAVCYCDSVENNLDYDDCYAAATLNFTICADRCDDDDECVLGCYSDYKENQKDCPCQENCPTGCPCPNYECVHEPQEPNDKDLAILVLNTYTEFEPALLLDSNGNKIENFEFTFGHDTQVWQSCSVLYQGDMMIFGGYDEEKRQVSKIKGCQLTREATDIPFDFDHGTCGSYVIDEVVQDVVLLCFPRNQPNDCWSFDGSTYREIPAKSLYEHKYARMSSYKGTPFVVGGFRSKAVEELKYGLWNELSEYPYSYSEIHSYAVVSTENSVIMFGGTVDDEANYPSLESDIVAEFRDGIWHQLGHMMQFRHSHGAINLGSKNIVFGGNNLRLTEIWQEKNSIWQGSFGSQHFNYAEYPEMFVVPIGYCPAAETKNITLV